MCILTIHIFLSHMHGNKATYATCVRIYVALTLLAGKDNLFSSVTLHLLQWPFSSDFELSLL